MKTFAARLFRNILLLSSFLAVAACGVTTEEGKSEASVSGKRTSSAYSAIDLISTDEADLSDDELQLRENPLCEGISYQYGEAIQFVLARYSKSLAYGQEDSFLSMVPAGHPKAPELEEGSGISLLVCADSQISAYTYQKTVALHDGLLWTLSEAALAAAIYGDDSFLLEKAIDEIVFLALEGRVGEATLDIDLELLADPAGFVESLDDKFRSALAFIIYHELGHVLMGHALMILEDGAPPDSSLEIQADIFAAAAMVTAGFSLEGIDLVFSILGRVNPEGSSAHPSSLARATMVQHVTQGENVIH